MARRTLQNSNPPNLTPAWARTQEMCLPTQGVFQNVVLCLQVYISLIVCVWFCAIAYKCIQNASFFLESPTHTRRSPYGLCANPGNPRQDEEQSMIQVLYPAVRQGSFFLRNCFAWCWDFSAEIKKAVLDVCYET